MTTTTSEYTLYPKVKTSGELPPKVLEHLDERYWNHNEILPGGGNGSALNVLEYGATGDGTTDDTAALQAAMNAAAGRALFIPRGTYIVSDTVRVRAGSTVFGEPGTVISVPGRLSNSVFRASGYRPGAMQVELANEVGTGDRVIHTKTPHGYAAGDVVKFQSQRVACSPDAGAWRLGWPTVGSNGPRFAEFARIQSVESATAFTLDTGLVFPGYRPDGSQETDSEAGSSTIIMKHDGAGDRVTIRDLEFEGDAREYIRFLTCLEPVAENIRVTPRGQLSAKAVQFIDCYLGVARRVEANCLEPVLSIEDHASRNLIHFSGSHLSGAVECRVVRGSQCYDITYGGPTNTHHTSLFCYVTDSESVSAVGNPITIHPGTYGIQITNCRFTECLRSGVAIRSNGALVHGNIIVGSGHGESDTDNPGIYLSEGGGKYSLVSGNTVEGFTVGFRVNDGGYKPFEGLIGATIRGNVFRDFAVGAARTRMTGLADIASSQSIILAGNTFLTEYVDAVGVLTGEFGRGSSGWSIKNNHFHLPRSGSIGVHVVGPSGEVEVVGNTFHSVGQPVARSTEGVTASSPATILHWWGNTVISAGIDRFPPPTSEFQIESVDGAILRLPDTAYSLNYAMHTARFYASSTTTAMSRGWPVEGFEGHVDVVRLSASLVTQTGHGTDGRRHSRTWSNGSWTNWKVA